MNELPRAALLSVAAALFVLLAAPLALAQTPQPSVTVTLATSTLELGASNSTTIDGTVTYADTAPALPTGASDGTITLAVAVPEGWTATLDPASTFQLAPGATQTFSVTLVAPALDAGAPDAVGDATFTATAQSPDGRSAAGSATVGLTALAPPAPLVPPWYQTPGGITAIAGAILLVVGTVAFLVWRRNKRLAAERAAEDAAAKAAYLDRETGIAIGLGGGPLQYGHKREVVYRLSVANKSARPRVAVVEVAQVTNGWRASTQFSKIPLSPGETQAVTLVVTPDAVITPGDKASVVVRAKPEEAKELDERLTLEVVAPKSGVPTDPHYKIVAVQREGANNQILRKT